MNSDGNKKRLIITAGKPAVVTLPAAMRERLVPICRRESPAARRDSAAEARIR